MFSIRRFILLSLYGLSIALSLAVFLTSGIYCQVVKCNLTSTEKGRQHVQIFPLCVSCLILVLSLAWLLTHLSYIDTECFQDYTCLEMPTAVFSSLLAGVCAVIEIHYSFDYSYAYWSEKWTLAAVKIGASTALVFLHATIAFTLT
uniref:Uncharacterized protein n=1 Tax=Acrobeloides nanus TaxID=290746 RepID=A0A914D699_9BILA